MASEAEPGETGGEGATEKTGHSGRCQEGDRRALLRWLCDTKDVGLM